MFTEAPCVILLQSTWQAAVCFPRFGGSAGHHPVLQLVGTVAEIRGAADHEHTGYAAYLRARWGPGNMYLQSRQFLDSLTWVALVKSLGNSGGVANESWRSSFPACRLQRRVRGLCRRELCILPGAVSP